MPEPNPAVPAKRESSDALRTVNQQATLVIQLHGDRFRQGPMFAAISGLKQAIPQARQGLTFVEAGCGFDPLTAIQEVVIGAQHQHEANPREPLGRFRIDPRTATAAILLDRPAEDALACLQKFVPVQQSKVGDNPALMLPTGGVLQAYNELLIYTPEAQAELTARRIREGAPLQPGVQAMLDGNPQATGLAYASGQNPFGLKWASLALAHPGGGLELKGVGLAESPEAALDVKRRVQEQLALLEQDITEEVGARDSGAAVAELLDRVQVESTGSSVGLTLTLDKQQAQLFFSEVVIALAKDSMQQYSAAAKTAEARDNVMRIALALSDYARAMSARDRRFPVSAPPAPPEPPGRQPASNPTGFDHASWKSIGFSPREPLYYSYEFVTASDGKSVEVLARGDLDGDGDRSKYSIRVVIEEQQPKIDPQLTRDKPYE
jgi:hypothetical protein